MDNEMKGGYAICLNEWALDQEIKNELGLLLIISSLTAEKGFCYASNQYFADRFDTNVDRISKRIKRLETKGYINIKYEKRGSEIISREIRLSKMTFDQRQNCLSTKDKNVEENNTSKNTTSINNKEINKEKPKYGTYNNVVLSDKDMETLKKEFPKDWQERINNLSEYCESTGKKYKNHLATIRNWANRDKRKKKDEAPHYEEDLPWL